MSDYKAKRGPLLAAIKQELAKGFVEDTFEVDGHKYTMRTLNEDDEVWADSYTRMSTSAAIVSSRKAPRLSVSIQAIDGKLKSELFDFPDDMKPEEREALKGNPIQYRYWVNDQMLMFLSEDSYRPFVNSLWEKYIELDQKREEAIKQLPNSSTRMPA